MDELDLQASLALPAEPASAGRARRFITDFCTAAGLAEDVCQTAALLTSELVTNAIRYGGSRAVLQAHMPGGALRIAVQDDNPELPVTGHVPSASAEGGRGVLLVSTLADRWGVEEAPGGGKAVWFELDAR